MTQTHTKPGEPAPTVAERVIKLASEYCGVKPDSIKPESNFIADLGMDSLDAVELVMWTEDEFDIEIPDEIAEKFKTVGDVINYVAGRQP